MDYSVAFHLGGSTITPSSFTLKTGILSLLTPFSLEFRDITRATEHVMNFDPCVFFGV